MDVEKREILAYLRSWPRQFVSATEICRRAGGKRRYRDNPRWALPLLVSLLEEGLIERDSTTHYRLKGAKPAPRGSRRWIAPHLAKILRSSGRDLEDYSLIDLDKACETDAESPGSGERQ